MKVINKTPHDIVIVSANGETLKVYPKGDAIRLSVSQTDCEPLDGVPTVATVFGETQGLPDFERGTYYIVSQMVKSANPVRPDLLVPANIVRDAKGNIIGCAALAR